MAGSAPSLVLGRATGRWVLLAAIMASSMAFIDGSALNVALPALQADLGASGADLLWIVNAYALCLAAGILVGGSLGDRLGRKRIFTLGIAIFAAASLACGLAPSTPVLIAARALQGIGGALMVPGSLAMLSANFPPGQRGRAIGLWSSFSSLTTAMGPVLGGWLSGQGLWRGIFFINLPLALIALAALHWRVPESRDERQAGPLDLAGGLLVTMGLAGLTYGFIEAPGRGWTNPLIAASLLGGLVCLAAFVAIEARVPQPIVPLPVFRSRTFTGSNLITLLLYAAISGIFFFFPLNLVQAHAYPVGTAGLALLPFVILLIVLGRVSGGLADRFGPRLPLTVGPALVGAGMALLAVPGLTTGPAAYAFTFLPGMAVIGLGMGLTVAPLSAAVMLSLDNSQVGLASGINNAVARMGGVLGIAVLGALALLVFKNVLLTHTAAVGLPPAAQAALTAQAAQLGAAEPPAGLTPATEAAVRAAVRQSLADTFRLLALLCAGLAGSAAVVAALTIEARPTERDP